MHTNITLRKGDTHYLEIAVTRLDENDVLQPVDITGCKFWFTAKNKYTDTDANAAIRKGTTDTTLTGIDITNAAEGEALIILQPTDTAIGKGTVFLFWDLQMEEPDESVTTVNGGQLALSDQVTISS